MCTSNYSYLYHQCKFLCSCNCFRYNLHHLFDNRFRRNREGIGMYTNLRIDYRLHRFDMDSTNIHQYQPHSSFPQIHPNTSKCSHRFHPNKFHHSDMGTMHNHLCLSYSLYLHSPLRKGIDMSREYFCMLHHFDMVTIKRIH